MDLETKKIVSKLLSQHPKKALTLDEEQTKLQLNSHPNDIHLLSDPMLRNHDDFYKKALKDGARILVWKCGPGGDIPDVNTAKAIADTIAGQTAK
jgi:hypothetical protein